MGASASTTSTTFDWHNETWGELAPMNFRRWYATGTTLADGKVLVTSGDDQSATDVVETPEMYNPATNTWTSLTAAKNYMPIYPFIYQLPDGRIVHLGGSELATASEVLDLSTNKWTTFDSRVIDGGSIANYAPGKFIKAGSAADDGFSGNSLKTAYTLNMNEAGAIWQADLEHDLPAQLPQPHQPARRHCPGNRRRHGQVGGDQRQRGPAGGGLEPGTGPGPPTRR